MHKSLHSLHTLGYEHIRGSPEFRGNVTKLYSPSSLMGKLPVDSVLITHGAIAANFLLLYTLVGPGDHVICMYPTYQQPYAVPESLDAEVELWKLMEENRFTADLEELDKLIRPASQDETGGTKLIIINNPIYRPLSHSLDASTHPPSIIDIYDHGIATGSISKAFSLAGLRVGWIPARQHEVVDACASARDYNTISVSQLDDTMAAYALSPDIVSKILERSVTLCNTNLRILDDFITRVPEVSDGKYNASYIKPTTGTTAFVKFKRKDGETVSDKRFCEELLERKRIMFLPGGVCFGHGEEFAGYFRIGYCCGTQVLKAGLKGLGKNSRTIKLVSALQS
ncbi:pyridoxal phosphate-dependent transferase [Morchella snyderi]|nr:pyridoxal phosphate-dependent transferase [Morchella snyderi]